MDLDTQERLIVRELIKDPRISDNMISKNTKVPVMTVNRKRKALEEKGLLNYFSYLNTGEEGTGIFHARQLYIIKMRSGITRSKYLDSLQKDFKSRSKNTKYIVESYFGEQDGHPALMMIMEAESQDQLVEAFNGSIVPELKRQLGEDCIKAVSAIRLTLPIRMLHNYLPLINMERGKIKKDWLDDWVFVDRLGFSPK